MAKSILPASAAAAGSSSGNPKRPPKHAMSMVEMSELEALKDLEKAMKALSSPEDGEDSSENSGDPAAASASEEEKECCLEALRRRRQSTSALPSLRSGERNADEDEEGGGFVPEADNKSDGDSSGTSSGYVMGRDIDSLGDSGKDFVPYEGVDMSTEYQVKIAEPDDDEQTKDKQAKAKQQQQTKTGKPPRPPTPRVLGVGRGPMPKRSSLARSNSGRSNASGTNASDDNSGDGKGNNDDDDNAAMKRSESSVSFHSLEIREYGLTLGDNVGCNSGPPVQLDWEYDSSNVIKMDVDTYEKSRGPRKVQDDMIMPDNLRWMRLNEVWGWSPEDMRFVMDNLEKIRKGEEVEYWFMDAASANGGGGGARGKNGGKGAGKKVSLGRMKKILAAQSARRRLKRLLK